MTPAARIEAVIGLLSGILVDTKPADACLSSYFRTRRYIGSKDRAAISQKLFRILRSYHRLSWHIGAVQAMADARALVIADLLLNREHSAISLDEAFSGEGYAPKPLSAKEKELAAILEKKALTDSGMPEQVRLECPAWAYAALQESLGGRLEAEMKAMMTQAPLDLRVNAIKATREEVLSALKEEGIVAAPGRLSPVSVRLEERAQITRHPLYTDGLVEIQDEGSQMVAVIADAKPGEQVADFCAGAGGKTLALAAMMQNKGRIVALDVLARRLEKAKLRFRRAGVHNIETRALDEKAEKWLKRQRGHFDLVLVDAPCTGTGTWRRAPDQRWRQLGPSLDELLSLQRDILQKAALMVRPGGRLVYATCSLLAQENELQIEQFLQKHPEFFRRDDFLKLTPATTDTDGFFAARLERKSEQAA